MNLIRNGSDRFNWLEALLIARTLDRPQEPTLKLVAPVTFHQLMWSGPKLSSSRLTKLFLSIPIDLLHLTFLVLTPVLQSNSQPANLTLTDVRTTDLRRQTKQGLLSLLVLINLFYRDRTPVKMLLNQLEQTICLV